MENLAQNCWLYEAYPIYLKIPKIQRHLFPQFFADEIQSSAAWFQKIFFKKD